MVLCNCLSLACRERSDPNGIRTRVTAVKGRCPRPLDDRVKKLRNIGIGIAERKANWQPNLDCATFQRFERCTRRRSQTGRCSQLPGLRS
jgi:hypothetical protein